MFGAEVTLKLIIPTVEGANLERVRCEGPSPSLLGWVVSCLWLLWVALETHHLLLESTRRIPESDGHSSE